ncbi:MAG TPA: bifunctional UDP-N-acetylglucosamine diphosphorylase/glucosamine-1-phosphate N-acetyltransferase GlmU [Candidatus Binatia bacterium]|jgi:bifunctional UDP-N-acetylglucosamine pyrophosphorylase/glucosamine-1-phosphate N-acetyltransferase|nr:bifunctional UDP-N-acetylglucosamine diphosphorylase/glucosamine-1-phosphate N-acetyltransferase GlmU [Candidatus Binatia bacterium]
MQELGVVVLAAGQGTRMKSNLPKVLHPLGGRPLFLHVLRTAQRLNPNRVAIVIGHGAESVRSAYAGNDVAWILQEQQRGTGHAVLCAKEAFKGFKGEVIILSGDVPFIREQTLRMLVAHHRSRNAAVTLLTAFLDEPKGYGRILRDDQGKATGIVEEKDATLGERGIREVNAGVYVVSAPFVFAALSEVKNHNRQSEYYLPDIVAIGLAQGADIETVRVDDVREMLGINSREELAFMEKDLRQSINKKWMLAGVTFKDPDTTYIEDGVTIGKDTVIGPNTQLRGKTVVGERCQIDGSAFLTDAQIGDEVHLRFSVVMTGCRVANGAIIGPFAHLRPGSNLGPNVHIGNFVETKEAKIGKGTKANHLTYLGDVTIGSEANIGAGTITCNYDGFHKYNTTIGDRVQVGSDTTLIAPVSLGDDVYVATASTVRHDVPAGALVYNQRDERVREGWTEQKRKKMKGSKK